jgi:hypothetical protein
MIAGHAARMEYKNLYQDGIPARPPGAAAARPVSGRVGRVRRIVASAAAATVLMGGGAAVGIAVTGGASAATGNSAAGAASPAGLHCNRLATGLQRSGHPKAARHAGALCRNPLLRLAAVGGLHGQVTFKAKTGTRTLAFERGTVVSAAGSVLTVRAPDGVTWSWDLVAGTVVRRGAHPVAESTLATGDQVLVAGQLVNGRNDARLVRIRAAG